MPAPHNPHGKHILRQIPQENTNLKKRLPGKGGKKKKIMINPERIKKGLYWGPGLVPGGGVHPGIGRVPQLLVCPANLYASISQSRKNEIPLSGPRK